ncbi:hypothetical protein ZWY2020_023424 [Hordeum vulgare]|nr:hypothetical protein ZWY2020_023424 [Hordeum vulgare]
MGYLVLQMVDLVAIFSGAASPEEEEGGADATKALGLAQMVVGWRSASTTTPRCSTAPPPARPCARTGACTQCMPRASSSSEVRASGEEEEGLPRRRRGVEEELRD